MALGWPEHVRVAVNVSPLQIELTDFYTEVVQALKATGLPPQRLEIEITEGVLLEHQQVAVSTLHALSTFGVKVAIDDFGTGFSSLAYLSRLPFDVLKIDKSFIDDMCENTAARRIVETIINLAKQLDKQTLAEGVESAEQATTLRALGCDFVQGYYFARPGTAGAVAALAKANDAQGGSARKDPRLPRLSRR